LSHANFHLADIIVGKMSVGYAKVASDSALLHGNSILKGFQEAEYYMQ